MTRQQKCLVAGIFIGLTVFAPFFVLVCDRRAPVTLEQGVIKPYNARTVERVSIIWPMIEHRLCGGEYVRHIRDASGKVHVFDLLPVTYSDTTSTDRRVFSKEMLIPKAVTPGPAIYWVSGHRWCNQLQRYIWPIPFRGPDIPFNVLPD